MKTVLTKPLRGYLDRLSKMHRQHQLTRANSPKNETADLIDLMSLSEKRKLSAKKRTSLKVNLMKPKKKTLEKHASTLETEEQLRTPTFC